VIKYKIIEITGEMKICGWWLVVGGSGWWLVAGGWWLVAGAWLPSSQFP
jgi:hypothetical protein